MEKGGEGEGRGEAGGREREGVVGGSSGEGKREGYSHESWSRCLDDVFHFVTGQYLLKLIDQHARGETAVGIGSGSEGTSDLRESQERRGGQETSLFSPDSPSAGSGVGGEPPPSEDEDRLQKILHRFQERFAPPKPKQTDNFSQTDHTVLSSENLKSEILLRMNSNFDYRLQEVRRHSDRQLKRVMEEHSEVELRWEKLGVLKPYPKHVS